VREIKPLEASMIAIGIVLTFFVTSILTVDLTVGPIEPKISTLHSETQTYENELDFTTILELNNTGKTNYDIYTVYFNDKASIEYNTQDQPEYFFTSNTIPAGKLETAVFSFPKGNTWKSEIEVEITIQMKNTQEYSKIIILP
jgi:hypothetical protein